MPEGTNTRRAPEPTELWKQWYDASTRAWADAVKSSSELYGDPFGLYRSWTKSVEDSQHLLQGSPLGQMNPAEMWQRWFEATLDIWRKAAQTGSDPLGITAKWLGMMEETQSKLQAGNIPYSEPFTFFRDWYNATSDTWAKMIEQYIGSEQFMDSATPFLESYASFFKTFRRANEEFFKNLQLPTRSDIARIAELVIALEEKVDRIDDTLDEAASNADIQTMQSAVEVIAERALTLESKLDALSMTQVHAGTVEQLDQRVERVESKLDALPELLSNANTIDTLTQRLDSVEQKVDALPAALSTANSTDALTQRLNAVEGKLDALPASLSNVHNTDALEQRLNDVESKLDALSASLASSNNTDALANRMNTVEGKLDTLLTTLERLVAQKSAEPVKPTETTAKGHSTTPRRKAQKKAATPTDDTQTSPNAASE